MIPKFYNILGDAVERGIRSGLTHHAQKNSLGLTEEQIENAAGEAYDRVMSNICEFVSFSDDEITG